MEGALFKNERKTRDEQPDFQGRIKVDGTEWWVSAWVNTARESGKQYLRLKISQAQQQSSPVGAADQLLGGGSRPPARDWGSGHVDDDISF